MDEFNGLPVCFWDEFFYYLSGTCVSLETALCQYFNHEEWHNADQIVHWCLNDYDFLRALDEQYFCCETCGWWYEVPDDDGMCDDCASDAREDDDTWWAE